MQTFYLTDEGRIRSHNEDSVTILKNENNEYLLAVADGMGGHSAGEVASSIAITYLAKSFKDRFNNLNKDEAIKWLREAVTNINSLIFKYASDHPESKGMGTTLVTAIVSKDYVLIGNIGDSSGFVLKDENLHKVTYDHTLVNLLVTAGELTEEEAVNHPKKNVLMKALGANDPIDIDIFDCDTNIKGIFLCSDGLTNMLEFDKIEHILNSNLLIEDKVVKLITKANNRGGTDNITIAYLEKEEGEL